jgi:putative CocE/NonD family hydrolase
MTPESRGGTKAEYRRTVEDGMLVERDVPVKLRDGDTIFADVFRPVNAAVAAPLVSWMPYGKHSPLPIQKIFPDAGVKDEWTSRHTAFECPDPVYWVRHGYAVVLVDLPGMWNSGGAATYCSPEEALAFYDVIEWAGTQPWSNGKVGLSGVSYLTVSQWRVAELDPPHLAAINPYEGWTDTYREVVRHGGIPSTWFWPYLWDRWGRAPRRSRIWNAKRRSIRSTTNSGGASPRTWPRCGRRFTSSRVGATRGDLRNFMSADTIPIQTASPIRCQVSCPGEPPRAIAHGTGPCTTVSACARPGPPATS